MENASKALIIAGAILLAILLISLGIMIFSQAQDTVSNSGMSDAQKSSFNSRFGKYEGNQKGSSVKTLIQEVIAFNANEDNGGSQIEISTDGTNFVAPGADLTSHYLTSKSYQVSITKYENGLVKQISIPTND